MTIRSLLAIGVCVLAVACGGGSGGGGNNSPTGPSPTGGLGATITLTPTGVSVQTVRIEVGQQVMFVNNAGRPAEIASDPHPTHRSCPPLDNMGMMNPGQSRSATLTQRGTCTYHDHLRDADDRFRGTILVGVSEPGPAPDYRTAW